MRSFSGSTLRSVLGGFGWLSDLETLHLTRDALIPPSKTLKYYEKHFRSEITVPPDWSSSVLIALILQSYQTLKMLYAHISNIFLSF